MISEFWIDADSIPKLLRPIIIRAALRLSCAAYFVADRELPDIKQFIAEDTHRVRVETGDSYCKSSLHMVVVTTGDNSADDYIVDNCSANSLCITHDIPLASRLLEKNCYVIDDRGFSYSKDNIRQLIGNREVNSTLRSWGVFSDQQKTTNSKENIKSFADNLDKTITKYNSI